MIWSGQKNRLMIGAFAVCLTGLLIISTPPSYAAEDTATDNEFAKRAKEFAKKAGSEKPVKEQDDLLPPELTSDEKKQIIKEGYKLAEEHCSGCHSVDKTGKSPVENSPPFREFANKWPLEALEETLAEGIVTGHEGMPEVVLEPSQITAFLAFLGSLKGK